MPFPHFLILQKHEYLCLSLPKWAELLPLVSSRWWLKLVPLAPELQTSIITLNFICLGWKYKSVIALSSPWLWREICSPLERFALLVCQWLDWDLVTAPANHTPPLINTIHCSIYNPISRPALWKGHINSLGELHYSSTTQEEAAGGELIELATQWRVLSSEVPEVVSPASQRNPSATLGHLSSCSECCRTNCWKRGSRWAKRGALKPEALDMKRTWHFLPFLVAERLLCLMLLGTFQGDGAIKARVHVVRAGGAGVAPGSASQPREHAPEGIY